MSPDLTSLRDQILSGFNIEALTSKMRADVDFNVPVNANIDASKKEQKLGIQYAPQRTTTYSPQFAPVDARSLILTMNSPYAVTKKSDRIYGAGMSTTVSPYQAPILEQPTDFGATEAPFKVDPSLKFGMGIDPSTMMLLGGVSIAAYFLFLRKKPKRGK